MDNEQIKKLLELLEAALSDKIVDRLTITIKPNAVSKDSTKQ